MARNQWGLQFFRSSEANIVGISREVGTALRLARHPKLKDMESLVFLTKGKHMVTSSVYNLQDSGPVGRTICCRCAVFLFARSAYDADYHAGYSAVHYGCDNSSLFCRLVA